MKKRLLVTGLVVSFMLVGCGKKAENTETTAPTTEVATTEVPTTEAKPEVPTTEATTEIEVKNPTYEGEKILDDWKAYIKENETFTVVETILTKSDKDSEQETVKEYYYKFNIPKQIEIIHKDDIYQANTWGDKQVHLVAELDEDATELANKKEEPATTEESTTESDNKTTESASTEADNKTTESASTEAITESTTTEEPTTEADTEEKTPVNIYKYVKNEGTALQVEWEKCIDSIYENTLIINKGAEYNSWEGSDFYFTSKERMKDNSGDITATIITSDTFIPKYILKTYTYDSGYEEQRVIYFEYGVEVEMPDDNDIIVEAKSEE